MRWRSGFRIGLVAIALAASPALAETTKEHDLCWRGRPSPECKAFLITELGLQYRLDDDPTSGDDAREHLSVDLGYARNVSRHDAVGASYYIATGAGHDRRGLRGFYRRWLSHDVALDVAPGVLVRGGEDGIYEYQAPGAIVGLSLTWKGWLSATVEAEHARYELNGTDPTIPSQISDTTWRAGGRLGAAPGLGGTIFLIGAVIVLGAIISSGAG